MEFQFASRKMKSFKHKVWRGFFKVKTIKIIVITLKYLFQ